MSLLSLIGWGARKPPMPAKPAPVKSPYFFGESYPRKCPPCPEGYRPLQHGELPPKDYMWYSASGKWERGFATSTRVDHGPNGSWCCAKIPKKPKLPPGYSAEELDQDNPYNSWMNVLAAQDYIQLHNGFTGEVKGNIVNSPTQLVNPTDAQLEKAFDDEFVKHCGVLYVAAGFVWVAVPRATPKYCAQFELVLPFLEKLPQGWRASQGDTLDKRVTIYGDAFHTATWNDKSLAKAAVLALLASRGWKISFNQTQK